MPTFYSAIPQCLLPRFGLGALLVLCAAAALAQPNPKSTPKELRYKYRDGNRWEGVKAKSWQNVSGKLELISFIFCDEKWRQQNAPESRDSLAIFFYAPAIDGIKVSVFDLDKLYFMDPHSNNFGKSGRNAFKWPAKVLRLLSLPANKLEALAQARVGTQLTYFPIYFRPASQPGGRLMAEFVFAPDKAMAFDVALYAGEAEQPLRTWPNLRAETNEIKVLSWPVDPNLAKQRNFTLVATEKVEAGNHQSSRKHVFYLYLSNEVK